MNVIHFLSLWLNNLPHSSATQACLAQDDKTTLLENLSHYVQSKAYDLSFPSDGSSWAILSPIERSIKAKIEKYGVPLKDWDVSINYGVKTGLNEAFIIDGKIKDRLIAQDPRSAEIIRPILRGRDIKRYGYTFADKWIIATFPALNLDIDDYPAIRDYLLTFDKRVLAQTGEKNIDGIKGKNARKKTGNKWFETQDQIAYWSLFAQPKIVWGELARTGTAFCYDEQSYFVSNTGYILTFRETSKNHEQDVKTLLSVLCVLNSRLMLFYLDTISSKFDVTGWRWLNQFVLQLPICSVHNNLATQAFTTLYKNTKTSQKECENLVFELYHLTHEEKAFLQTRYDAIFH